MFTAKQIERDALNSCGLTACQDKNGKLCYQGSIVNSPSKLRFDLVHYMIGASTNLYSASTVSNCLALWDPEFVILLGIAAGFEDKGVNIGDVLVSDKVVYYEKSKVKEDGVVEIRYDSWKSSDTLRGFLEDICTHKWQFRSRLKKECTKLELSKLNVHFGSILSGEKIVDDPEFRKELQKGCPEAIGLEMEAAGIHVSLWKSFDSSNATTIKGVSDYAQNKKDDYQKCAACSAAEFFLELLENGVLEPFQAVDRIIRDSAVRAFCRQEGLIPTDEFLKEAHVITAEIFRNSMNRAKANSRKTIRSFDFNIDS